MMRTNWRRVGYSETAELVRSATGAAEVVGVRSQHPGRAGPAKALAVVMSAPGVPHPHRVSDTSAQSQGCRVLGRAPVPGQRWRFQRLAPDAEPLRDCPLALCDAVLGRGGDLLAADLYLPHRTGQIYYVAFQNPAHRWFLLQTCEKTRFVIQEL